MADPTAFVRKRTLEAIVDIHVTARVEVNPSVGAELEEQLGARESDFEG
jgi:hypothetical protein